MVGFSIEQALDSAAFRPGTSGRSMNRSPPYLPLVGRADCRHHQNGQLVSTPCSANSEHQQLDKRMCCVKIKTNFGNWSWRQFSYTCWEETNILKQAQTGTQHVQMGRIPSELMRLMPV